MTAANSTVVGSVVALWRYPVKSMQGEELNASAVTARGLLGDRTYALVDDATGKIVSAKNPKKWPNLFAYRASYREPPVSEMDRPVVRITLPDGTILHSEQHDLKHVLSTFMERPVTLQAVAPLQPKLEEYWPDVVGLAQRETVTEEAMPAGTFFDLAPVHVLTMATLNRLRELYPRGRFETRRFRPNIAIAEAEETTNFTENAWVGRSLMIGDVRLRITGPCPRCVMTTLPQSDLPRDLGILRTAVQHNQGNVGVYATVLQSGTIRRGDFVQLD